jgi:hypothetical protein
MNRAGLSEGQLVPGRVEDTQGSSVPLPPERYVLQLGMEKSTHGKLRYAQALLSHAVPWGDVAQVLDRALDALILQLEKRKLGSTTRVRRQGGPVEKHCIPSHVRRAVWERDQGRCTFLSANGKRCTARRFLEFDHVDPVARGGKATVDGMRLRCRAHNQYEAERVFGAGFMRRKREEARIEAERRGRAKEQTQDILAGLRNLGCRPDEARRAAEYSEALHGVTLEERMRAALRFLGERSVQRGRVT